MELHIEYKPLNKDKYYVMTVSRLYTIGKYRVAVYEEYDAHDSQIADFNLRSYQSRREFEQYVADIANQVHLKGVYFGDGDCIGDHHYTLERYKRDHDHLDFIQDINLPNFK